MEPIKAIIFDMDGTLYSFDEKAETHFSSSQFGKKIKANCLKFFEEKLVLSPKNALSKYRDLDVRYSGEISLALEKEFGIDRSEYFDCTWNLAAESFIVPNQHLFKKLQEVTVQKGVLTAAPKVWAEKALHFLGVRELFGTALFTGDPDVRKPNPAAFLQLAEFWGLEPTQMLSIGDQEATDILPAKSLGMRTVRIAKQTTSSADFVAPDVIAALTLLQQKGII